jgi:hypothetical protein
VPERHQTPLLKNTVSRLIVQGLSMPNIRIEYVPIQRYNLGWFGFDHLQLTYEPDEIPILATQDDWYVLEGDLDTTTTGVFLGIQGTTGNLRLSTANLASGDDLIRLIGTPRDRGSVILPVQFDLIGNWLRMANYGAGIEASAFPYIAYGAPASPYPTFNSSSVIASLLWQIGIDVNLNIGIA